MKMLATRNRLIANLLVSPDELMSAAISALTIEFSTAIWLNVLPTLGAQADAAQAIWPFGHLPGTSAAIKPAGTRGSVPSSYSGSPQASSPTHNSTLF